MQTMSPRASEQSESAESKATRITVTFDAEDYTQLQRVAETKRVSASWVVRDAVRKYLDSDVPLLARGPAPHTPASPA